MDSRSRLIAAATDAGWSWTEFSVEADPKLRRAVRVLRLCKGDFEVEAILCQDTRNDRYRMLMAHGFARGERPRPLYGLDQTVRYNVLDFLRNPSA